MGQVATGETWEIRAARNQTMFRALNEHMRTGTDAATELVIACECANTECAEELAISVSRYERLREHPNRFAVLPSHVFAEVEDVVETHEGLVVVAKRGEAGSVASAAHRRARA